MNHIICPLRGLTYAGIDFSMSMYYIQIQEQALSVTELVYALFLLKDQSINSTRCSTPNLTINIKSPLSFQRLNQQSFALLADRLI